MPALFFIGLGSAEQSMEESANASTACIARGFPRERRISSSGVGRVVVSGCDLNLITVESRSLQIGRDLLCVD